MLDTFTPNPSDYSETSVVPIIEADVEAELSYLLGGPLDVPAVLTYVNNLMQLHPEGLHLAPAGSRGGYETHVSQTEMFQAAGQRSKVVVWTYRMGEGLTGMVHVQVEDPDKGFEAKMEVTGQAVSGRLTNGQLQLEKQQVDYKKKAL
jgi:hypothetical protein